MRAAGRRSSTNSSPATFVIIQFGHNDEKIDKPGVGTDAATTFRDNLRRFIKEVRAKQASPILATPVARGNSTKPANSSPRTAPTRTPCAPSPPRRTHRYSNSKKPRAHGLTSVGDEPSKKFFMWIEPGKFAKLPDGRKDDTHFVEAGAVHVAELAVAQMRELKLPLAQWLK